MLKTKNRVFSILLMFTLLFIISVKVEAATKLTRLSGLNRYATSAAVATDGWQQSDYVILTSGANFPDALSAAPLAKKYNAPIMLTQKDVIPTETINALQVLKVKNILIVGGTGVISTTVEDKIKSMGIKTTRFSGADRYGTAIKVAEQLDNVSEIFIVTGEDFPDALSVSPIAVKRNMPIILIGHNTIPEVVKSYISSHNIAKTYVIGAGSSLDQGTLSTLSNVEKISGVDKYEKNLAIIDRFKSDLDFNTIYMTSGENFPDGLTGSILAGKNSNAMFLVGNDSSSEKNYFSKNSIELNNIKVLGGTGVVTEATINNLIDSTTNTNPDLSVTDIAKNVNGIVKLEARDKNNNIFATGSGCIISSEGKLITNYHVINGAYSADVVLEDEAKYEVGEILGYSKEKDLAILTLKNASNLPKVGLGDSETLKLGDQIVTIGSPAGIQNTISTGIVSGLNRTNSREGKDIQISAAIDKGSAGGGLFNMSGQVIGITYLAADASSEYNYAIPINEVKPLINITTTTTLSQLAASTTPVTAGYFPFLTDVPVPANANYYKALVSDDAKDITYYFSKSSILNNFFVSYSKLLVDSGFKLSETSIVNENQVTKYTKGDNSISIGFVGYDIYVTGKIH
ncbi:cell wall-binding repeat-containing protein [Clostridium sp.]|uniref:cell wall-binding repeat-containing protein n=1 Tax=Clostridium sp. TaxID=1506 RepID=UPI003D6D060D